MAPIFNDNFEVLAQDPDGKKFDNVSRYVLKSDLYEVDVTLDVNIDVYPMEVGKKYNLELATSLRDDASNEKYDAVHYIRQYKTRGWDSSVHMLCAVEDGLYFGGLSGKSSLMDKYEYVMHGKVYKYKDNQSSGQVRVEVYISFGGLLMLLVGDPKKFQALEVDSSVYLLVRKL